MRDFKLSGPAPLQTKDAVACGDLGCVYNHLDWSVFVKLGSGCKANTTSCEVNVQPRPTWTPVYVRQNNNPAILYLLWNSGKPGATITGYVRDKDEQGVENATVTASGGDGGSSPVDATTGYYAINVKAGQYTITPAGGPSTVVPPRFEPASRNLVLQAGDVGRADFTLNGGLKVSLGLSQSSVEADGLTVVKGEIRTTQFGEPDGGVTVVLRPKPEDSSDAAVTSGPAPPSAGPRGPGYGPPAPSRARSGPPSTS